MKNLSLIVVLMLALATFQSCEKDDATDEGVAPELPPVESFIMPFDGFEDADTTGLVVSDDKSGVSYYNWFYSATNLVVWNTVLTLNLAIPVAAFGEAFNHEAEYLGDGIWSWKYTSDFNGQTYESELTAQFINSEEIQWDMYIAQVGGFSKVNWFTGITHVDGKSATWTLNYDPYNPKAFVQIDFEENVANGVGFIRYTNIIPNHKDNGDYLEYREIVNPTVEFDRAYDIFRNSTDNLLEIQWNEANGNGRVKNNAEFGDDEWHCWDTEFLNTEC